jgi:hypothetical protein
MSQMSQSRISLDDICSVPEVDAGYRQCVCGNIFAVDARFCRICGRKRPIKTWEQLRKLGEDPRRKEVPLLLRQLTLKANLKDPRLRIDKGRLLERLFFRVSLRHTLIKIVMFIVYLVLFFLMLQNALPSDQASAVRRQLETVLGISNVGSVTSPETLLVFAGDMARRLESRRATAETYWCSAPHQSTQWDASTEAPKRVCSSPRDVPLGYKQTVPWVAGRRLDTENAADLAPATSRLADAEVLFDDDRRLSQESNTTSTTITSTTTTSTSTTSECIDKDILLAGSLGQANATCLAKKATICDSNIGSLYCPSTCGLCPPFKYRRLRDFIGPSVAIAPLVIYQTRFASRECDGWIQGRRNTMAAARTSFSGSASSAPSKGASLETSACVDRSTHQSTEHALKIACPSGVGSACAANTSLQETPKRSFLGHTVYAHMLLQPDLELQRMQVLEWLDSFTDTATLSALTYTEGLEVFTLFSVQFKFDLAGNVESKVSSWSYKDSSGGDALLIFIGVGIALIVVGIAHTATEVKVKVKGRRNPFRVFELVTRCLLLLASIGLLVWWIARIAIAEEFEEVLRAFLSVESPAQDPDAQQAISVFFSGAQSLVADAERLNWLCCGFYVVASFQLVQLAVYFHEAHPKMAVVTCTMRRALSGLLHVAVLLLFCYIFFAFALHWIFGRSLKKSETFAQAMRSQLQMIYGEYIRLPGVASLDADAATFYWIYAVIFLVVAFFILRFVFLAVLLKAYNEVKQSGLAELSANSFLRDAYDVLARPLLTLSKGWPSEKALIQWLLSTDMQDDLIRPEQFIDVFGGPSKALMPSEAAVDAFVAYLSTTSSSAFVMADVAGVKDQRGDPRQQFASSKAKQENAPPPPELDVKKVARRVVRDVTSLLAQQELSDVNWLAMTGKVTSTLYSEFSASGLITNKGRQY